MVIVNDDLVTELWTPAALDAVAQNQAFHALFGRDRPEWIAWRRVLNDVRFELVHAATLAHPEPATFPPGPYHLFALDDTGEWTDADRRGMDTYRGAFPTIEAAQAEYERLDATLEPYGVRGGQIVVQDGGRLRPILCRRGDWRTPERAEAIERAEAEAEAMARERHPAEYAAAHPEPRLGGRLHIPRISNLTTKS